jgi:hypothetical protein
MAVLSLLLASSTGCKTRAKSSPHEAEEKAALAALEVFHGRLRTSEFEAIYQDASEVVRARPNEEVLAAMKHTQEKWGKLLTAEVKSATCYPEEVRILAQAKFEKGEAGEMTIWHVPDGKARLQHFRVFPGPVEVPPSDPNECRPKR